MRCRSARDRAKQISRHNHIRIRAADAARALLRDPAGAHVTVLTADSGDTEGTLRLLLIEAIEHRLHAQLLHMKQHLPDSRVRRLLDYFFFIGKGLLISIHCLRIIIKIILAVVMMMVMTFPGNPLLISLRGMMMVRMRICFVIFRRCACRCILYVLLFHFGIPFFFMLFLYAFSLYVISVFYFYALF